MKCLNTMVVIAVFSAGWVSLAYADSIRCGRAVVKVGDSTNTLIKKCGKPADKFSSRISINENGQQRQTSVSNWVYRKPGQKDRVVSVYAGEVARIDLD